MAFRGSNLRLYHASSLAAHGREREDFLATNQHIYDIHDWINQYDAGAFEQGGVARAG
jgi:hypothetical protein